MRDREAYCSTLAIVPEYQRTRIVHHLLRAFIRSIAYRVDTLWFTVSEENAEARALHATLGAHELGTSEEYFGPGEPRIVSRIERPAFEKLRARMELARLASIGAAAPSRSSRERRDRHAARADRRPGAARLGARDDVPWSSPRTASTRRPGSSATCTGSTSRSPGGGRAGRRSSSRITSAT